MVSMSKLARIADVECLDGYALRLTFSDGLVRELDFDSVLVGGVLEALREPALFAQVAVDQTTGTIGWPNGVDLDPDVLHGDHDPASAPRPTVIREYHLRATG
jgi:Protein of unknown function (DUF2442)